VLATFCHVPAAAEVYVGHELPLEVFVFHVSGCWLLFVMCLLLLPMVLAAAEVYVGHELPLEVFVFHVSGCWLLFVTISIPCVLLL
jgi:hypothetical protein